LWTVNRRCSKTRAHSHARINTHVFFFAKNRVRNRRCAGGHFTLSRAKDIATSVWSLIQFGAEVKFADGVRDIGTGPLFGIGKAERAILGDGGAVDVIDIFGGLTVV
jgi:hypothetical protein